MTQPIQDPFGLVGTVLSGKYAVEAIVAETELSIVYRANHRVWQRPVAIKAFKAPTLGDGAREQMLESFVREGVLLMDLSERCSAICQARDVGSTITTNGDWVPLLILEWLEGKSLEVVLARERDAGAAPRSVAQAVRLLGPIAAALALAHERHIVHGDVKPGNVFLLAEYRRGTPRCKLLDFGIARALDDASGGRDASQPPAVRSFTPAYGAPEQFSARYGRTGPWTDVFALALICVEILTGREPLRGATLEAIEAEACNREVRPTARALGAHVSDEVEQVLVRALSVDPEDRYSNARDFWGALRGAAARDAEAPPSDAAPERPSGRRRISRDSSTGPAALGRRIPARVRRRLLLALAAGAACIAVQRYAPWFPTARAAEVWARLQAFQSSVTGQGSARSHAARGPSYGR